MFAFIVERVHIDRHISNRKFVCVYSSLDDARDFVDKKNNAKSRWCDYSYRKVEVK